MRDLYSKTNAPYLIAGALATLVLLASGTLAVAPYVKFLSSVAAFNVALPVALSLSILSILVLALSCKIISNNKKIEVEKNKFAEKEQELKQQLESKVQELENEITLGKEAASKEVEVLNNQLNELTQEKQGLEKEVVELKAKVKGQLKHREEILSCEHQELRDENTRLKDEKGNLQGELCKTKDKLSNLAYEYDDLYGVCSLDSQHTALEEKVGQLELVLQEKIKRIRQLNVQLRKEKGETSCLQPELRDVVERERRLKEKLSEKAQEMIQLAVDLEQKEKLCKELEEKETKDLNKIGELNKFLDQERKENEKLRDNNSELKSSKKDFDDECSKLRRRNSDLERKVKHLQAVIGQEDKPSHSISSDVSSEHSSEFKGTGENTSANEQFSKPKPPYISTPTRSLYTKLNDASCDSGYTSRCSTPTNSH